MSPRPLDKQSLLVRELQIMEAALSLMDEMDVTLLTMDKVVARVPYSKGTVYSHFSCKEDLFSGLSNHALRTMIGLFQRAAEHEGSSRERFMAMQFAYLIWSLLKPTLFRASLCVKSPSVMGKSSPERMEEHDALEQKMMTIWHRMLDDGLADGSFILPLHMSKHQVAFTGWASGYGTIMLLSGDIEQCAGRHGLYLEREYFNAINIFLDGLNWHPLSSEVDYRTALQRVLNERFQDELAELETRGRRLIL